jgi:type VI secretion system protein ImpG
MIDALFPYYERELVMIRHSANEFARQYPAAAGRLLLDQGNSVDPHVERLIESFALLAGRIHRKIDDEFPELIDALLSTLYPHYLSVVPSMAIAQFVPDAARTNLAEGFTLPRGAVLRTPAVNELPCHYRTAYPVTLWPVALTSARLQAPPFPDEIRPPANTAAVLRLRLRTLAGAKFSQLRWDRLRFYLAGDRPITAYLYELIFNNVLQVQFRAGDENSFPPIVLPPAEALRQVGFEQDEGLLPYPPQSFLGYRLLTELFTFPAKFMFVDLYGLDRVCRAGCSNELEVLLYLDRYNVTIAQAVTEATFQLGCTPIVNLLEKTAEPIALSHRRDAYVVVPDVAQPLGLEVYSINQVTGVDGATGATQDYQPFYSFRHGSDTPDPTAFWYSTRRAAASASDQGTDVYLHLVDLNFEPARTRSGTVVVRTTCTNRNLPVQLHRAGEGVRMELESAAPLAALHCIFPPTVPFRPPRRRHAYWRLLSHLSLNHLSLVGGDESRHALQEILRIYDFSDPESGHHLTEVNRLLVEGITGLASRTVVARTGNTPASGFCRGLEVTLEFDEEKYIGTGVFLFAAVLERFLGLYANVNSFCQLVARVRQREGILRRWAPRAGEQVLL